MDTKDTKERVKLPRTKALKLLDWHGGQTSALYALGSSSLTGHTVPRQVAQEAIWELKAILRMRPRSDWRGLSQRDKADLRSRIRDIEAAMGIK